ncbi:putative glycosyltransferase [Limimaricola hongkongensis DSM 17492]|uniref:Putative glycosyltransferase n=2 Tax=Limimaricola hongkongensis TaxID=278132 RepID=A0A017HFI3_9RHOB|nr:putative glycosyltransferase [Limimaricola hongkongensis DSM 17492]
MVSGHILPQPYSLLAYVLNMPFFFFVGGYLFRGHEPFGEFLHRKAHQFLVPYFGLLLLLHAVKIALDGGTDDLHTLTWRMLYGGELLQGWFAVFWFPPCYFATLVCYHWLNHRVSSRALWAIMAGSTGLALLNQWAAPAFHLPLALNVVAMALPIYHLGAMARRLRIHATRQGVLTLLAALITLAYIAAALHFQAPPLAMKRASYGWPLVSVLASLSACLPLLFIAHVAAQLPGLNSLLQQVGVAALTVMYLHQPLQYVIADHFGLHHPFARYCLSVALALAAHRLIERNEAARWLFLGTRRAPVLATSAPPVKPG